MTVANQKNPTFHPEGIVFGMAADAYHADPALGSTELKTLMKSAADYWWSSWMNSDASEPHEHGAPHLRLGSALHTLVLEGERAFHSAFSTVPIVASGRQAMKTADDLRVYLREKALSTTGTKSILSDRVRAHWAENAPPSDPCPIWDDLLDAASSPGDKTLLSQHDYDRVFRMARALKGNPILAEYLGIQHAPSVDLASWYSEVSVFWREHVQVSDGEIIEIPCKARFDRLGLQAIIDLKTMATPKCKALSVAIPLQSHAMGYDLQAVHYMAARDQARRFVREGSVFGADTAKLPAACWLDSFERTEALKGTDDFSQVSGWCWLWIFIQTTGAPVVEVRLVRHSSDMMIRARAERMMLLRRYAVNAARFGSEEWAHPVTLRELTMKEMPSWPRFRAD